MAWPEDIIFPSSSPPQWVIVKGTHMVDPCHVWCVFSPDKANKATANMWRSLRELVDNVCFVQTLTPTYSSFSLLQAPPPVIPDTAPLSPDSVYAVYCDKNDWWAEPQWCRGWLLQDNHTFFLLDFGFTITVPSSHILPLPPACCGVPPQVMMC